MIGDAEEADFFCCGAELLCDFVNARVEVGKRDGGNGPVQVLCRCHDSWRNAIRTRSVDEDDTNMAKVAARNVEVRVPVASRALKCRKLCEDRMLSIYT